MISIWALLGCILEAQPLHVTRQVSEVVLNLPVEPADVAHLALDVLAQRAQRLKLLTATRVAAWTMIHLLLVRRACEMLIEGVERTELAMAQEAFVGLPVPGELSRKSRDKGWLRVVLGICEHAGGNGDNVLSIVFGGSTIDLLSRNARATGT